MDDPYIEMENLDGKVLEYVKRSNEEFRSRFGNPPKDLKEEIRKYHGSKKVLSVKVTEKGILSSYIEDGRYVLALEGEILYSTENVIFWIDSDNTGRKIAVFDTPGSDRGTLTVMEDGRTKEKMDGSYNGIVFFGESYYTIRTFLDEPPEEGAEVNSHRVLLGDRVVFGSGLGPGDFISLSESNGTAFAVVGDWLKSRVYSGPVDQPEKWELVKECDFPVVPLGVKDGKSYFFEENDMGRVTSGDQVIFESNIPLESAVLVEEGILAVGLQDAKVLPILYDFHGNRLKDFPLSIPMGLRDIDSDGKVAVLALESFGVKYALFRYGVKKLELVSENSLLVLDVAEHFVESNGAKIHFFRISGPEPETGKAVVYGYGGFNIPVTPMFFPLFAYLLNHGVTVVVTNLRGGSEYGREWHQSGIREKKMNVFDDFRSVIKSLKDQGIETVAYGVSNGGLLVGEAVTHFPELLKGAVIGNPVLDMMRFHRMSVGRFWVSEYGDPDVPGDAEFLIRYSPYHNIRDIDYPKTMIYTRFKDDRVHPAHAIKFHRAMRDKSGEAYLRVNTTGGHIGISPEEMVSEISDICIFILSALDLQT